MEHENRREMSFATSEQQQEGVLNDVLVELDRERTRRAELEAQMRVLAEEKALLQSAAPPKDQQGVVEKREWVALETERNELVRLIEALTRDNDAISAASKSSSETSLPVHVVRLLEIMPWDQRARQSTIATEEIYEWQVYDVKGGRWTSQLRQFPPFFRTMPITKPTPGRTMDENPSSMDGIGKNLSKRIFGERPPKQCVMTDSSTTRVFNINDGFPLPKDGGTWQWIGGWRIDKRVIATPKLDGIKKTKVDCDEHGWSYAEDPRHFQTNPTELCWDSAGETGGLSVFRRTVRRRKWTRRRALLSYPFASERTKEYLKSVADNAVLEVTISKLNDQLIETKVQLTECEEKLMHKDELEQKVERLETDNARLEANLTKLRKELFLTDRRKELKTSLTGSEANVNGGKTLENDLSAPRDAAGEDGSFRRPRLEDVDKIRSALTNFVSDTSDRVRFRSDDGDGTAAESDGDDSSSSSPSQKANETDANDGGQESFDWKRFGRGAVLDKIKRAPAVKSLPSWRSPSQSGAAVVPEQNKETQRTDHDLSLPSLK